MMLLVSTKIGVSNISGIGLFAASDIKKGQLIWEFTPGFDLKVTGEDLERLSLPAKRQFLNYCYQSKESGIFVLCFDDARFLNHSENPNLIDDSTEEGFVIAAKDIEKGEELTVDYRTYDDDYIRKMSTKE